MPSRSTFITIRISPEEKELLSRLCKEAHIYSSTYIALLIQEELHNWKQTGKLRFVSLRDNQDSA